MIILHHPDCASYGLPGHPERPQRVTTAIAHLRRTMSGLEWREARAPLDDVAILRAHTEEHLVRLGEPRPFDGDTPYHEGIDRIARLGVGGALEAVDRAQAGAATFSLMRPPGHHATAERAMGFCYLNNIAVAALHAQAAGAKRVAVWDFDAHHGNGTEDILRGREGCLFVSVHQYPGYPGTGTESVDNCRNFPVAPDTPSARHMETLRRSWDAVLGFRPDLVLVSAGFDAYVHDPITTMCLEEPDFLELGRWLHAANLPTAALLEGGYSDDLPRLVAAFLEGWREG
ncbi:histone deacetylase family protein [Opitutales bacterium ASA1]|uniref:histone deacetylase family protein n=1 Tax=Congregicoccus parvus TaxID=3081749 RepID=UPI002B2B603B|nr:histone deacetylase family protein [Opitutales bacterium ASA1]